ncbi:MAG: hypothetical protein MJ210_05315 [Alphaproteobacteria bacterium]|nr:hypothetical protein [Alphaproteobacteria bacterium]
MQLRKGTGKEIDVRAVEIHENMAWGISYKKTEKIVVSDYDTALKLHAKTAVVNWIFGWWHPQTFITNIKSIIKNFKTPVSSKESLKVLLHNMIFYAKEGQNEKAVKCGVLAENLLGQNSKSLERFLSALSYQVMVPQKWNLSLLRLCQLIVPFALGIIVAIALLKNSMDLNNWNFFSKKKEIDYYQKVDFGTRGQSVDDVVVGKILSIPIDKSDSSKLYHLTEEAKVMYGPSDDFDMIKILKEGTTIRLTGMTPDNIWARIMIDNGEIGFVRLNILKQGTGKEIPFGSAIVE